MNILVAIASYGTNNDLYLRQLIDEYTTMSFDVDIVVVSNVEKKLGPTTEVVVGLPSKNPWSLPFAHKQIFVERLENYDLFIYSEDDTLITEHHIQSFLQVTKVLQEDEIAGFLRSEEKADGTVYYSTVHNHYHWDNYSVCRRGDDIFAFFTNEHGACYILTQDHLQRSIASGGFFVPPHEGKYDMLVTAATDPYTQCGFKKLVCISRLADFTCKHLTNKYIGRTGTEKTLVDVQINALLNIEKQGTNVPASLRVESRLPGTRWTKSYYEPCQNDLLSMVSSSTQRALSLGCGWGETEKALINKGIMVTAIPLDIVIGKVAETRGIRVISTALESGKETLAGERFDLLLISYLLHLVDDPVRLLRVYRDLLSDDGSVIVSCPNMRHLALQLRRLANQPEFKGLGNYELSGIHKTTTRLVTRWLHLAGFSVQTVAYMIEGRWKGCNQMTLGLVKDLWANQFAVSAKRQSDLLK